MVQSMSSTDRLATIPALPSAAPNTASTYGPATGSRTTTYNLDQFRQTSAPRGVPSPSSSTAQLGFWDRARASLAPIHRAPQNREIYEQFIARARQMDWLMPGHGDRRRVITLQQKLNAVGIQVPVNGTFDYATSTAVRNFKARVGIREEYLDRQGNYAVSDVMTTEAEAALDQLAQQAGWRPTGPLTDAQTYPGWNSRENYARTYAGGSVAQAPVGTPGYAPATGATYVSPADLQFFQELQQKVQRNGYTPNAQERARYEDIRQRLVAQRSAPQSPVAAPGQVAANDPMALLNSPNIPATGPVSPAEAAAADAFEATLAANPQALDNMPGIMYRNFLTIRARQAANGQQPGGVGQPTAQLPATYTVQRGDTFQSIAASLGIDANALFSANADRLAEWQRAHPEMTRRFNEYYRTQQVPNPYLLPIGFQLTIPGGGGAMGPGAAGNGSSAPASTFTSAAVDVAQYEWLMANMDAYQANTLSPADRAAFEHIANKQQVTPELDALLNVQNSAPAPSGRTGTAPSMPSYSGPTMVVDVNDQDPELQAALAILAKLESGQPVSDAERAQYRQLMASYRARTFLGG